MQMNEIDFDVEIEGKAVMIMINGQYELNDRREINQHIQKELDKDISEQELKL